MALIPRFTNQTVIKALGKKFARLEREIILRLQRVGIAFVADARSVNTYQDQTKNLRSSIGFVILKNGEQIDEDFKGETSEGVATARRLIEDLRKNYPSGYVLICVAGMEYAAAVESKGYDVITGSSQTAIIQLKKSFDDLQKRVA